MEKVLNELKAYKDYFDAEEEDFEMLKKLGITRLGFITSESIKVTPLLEKIASYALISEIIPSMINDYLVMRNRKKKNTNEVDPAMDIMELCYAYMGELVECDCMHPTVMAYDALTSAKDRYDNVLDNIAESYDLLSKNFKDYFEDALAELEQSVEGKAGSEYFNTTEKLKKSDNPKEVLESMSKSARAVGLYHMMVKPGDVILTYNDHDDVFIASSNQVQEVEEIDNDIHNDDRKENKKSVNPKLLLSEMIQAANTIIEGYIEDNIDRQEKKLEVDDETEEYKGMTDEDEIYLGFSNATQAYNMYKDCQYQYVKNYSKVDKILKDCNKDVK